MSGKEIIDAASSKKFPSKSETAKLFEEYLTQGSAAGLENAEFDNHPDSGAWRTHKTQEKVQE